MALRRNLERNLAQEKVSLLFYQIMEKEGKRMLKPLKLGPEVKVPLKLIRAIADDTVIPRFFDTLASDLRERGVPPGSKVQLRAKFSPEHEMLDPALKGTRVLCEITV